jgi:hypothetical protein
MEQAAETAPEYADVSGAVRGGGDSPAIDGIRTAEALFRLESGIANQLENRIQYSNIASCNITKTLKLSLTLFQNIVLL